MEFLREEESWPSYIYPCVRYPAFLQTTGACDTRNNTAINQPGTPGSECKTIVKSQHHAMVRSYRSPGSLEPGEWGDPSLTHVGPLPPHSPSTSWVAGVVWLAVSRRQAHRHNSAHSTPKQAPPERRTPVPRTPRLSRAEWRGEETLRATGSLAMHQANCGIRGSSHTLQLKEIVKIADFLKLLNLAGSRVRALQVSNRGRKVSWKVSGRVWASVGQHHASPITTHSLAGSATSPATGRSATTTRSAARGETLTWPRPGTLPEARTWRSVPFWKSGNTIRGSQPLNFCLQVAAWEELAAIQGPHTSAWRLTTHCLPVYKVCVPRSWRTNLVVCHILASFFIVHLMAQEAGSCACHIAGALEVVPDIFSSPDDN
ncbi:hypothetical protein Bbelb_029500 [Branchiostoma belcheri]|nr:hypothetical protein Bbelb_029500 [Branchiostoma belcheri]